MGTWQGHGITDVMTTDVGTAAPDIDTEAVAAVVARPLSDHGQLDEESDLRVGRNASV